MHPRFPAIPTLGHRAARGATAWRRAAGFALLVVLTGLLAPPALGMPRQGELATPLELKAKTTSGTPVKGQIQSWTFETVTGTFGSRRWTEFQPPDLNRIFKMVMDEKSAEHWIALGELLMQLPGGEKMSDQAFGRARKLDKECQPAIDKAKVRGQEKRRLLAEERLKDILPDGTQLTATPWPSLTDEEQKAAVAEMKRDAQKIMRDANTQLPLIETRYFLLYADLPQAEANRWASQLDGMYDMVMQLFHVEKGLNLFWGKAVVFIFPNQERFRLVESAAFQQTTPAGVVGLCHMLGPKVFVNSFRDPDELQFTAVLLHETTHGIMHRYLTPARLPTWANEGFAERIASAAMKRANLKSPVDRNRREQGLQYIRQSGDLARIMKMNYQDGSWPGENAVGYAVGYMLCNFMLDTVPRLAPKRDKDRFKDWVIAVKGGKPWEKALVEDYGFSMEQIATEAVRWFRTND